MTKHRLHLIVLVLMLASPRSPPDAVETTTRGAAETRVPLTRAAAEAKTSPARSRS